MHWIQSVSWFLVKTTAWTTPHKWELCDFRCLIQPAASVWCQLLPVFLWWVILRLLKLVYLQPVMCWIDSANLETIRGRKKEFKMGNVSVVRQMWLSGEPAFMHAASAVEGGCDLGQFGAARRASPLCSLVQVSVPKIARSVQHSLLCRTKKKKKTIESQYNRPGSAYTHDMGFVLLAPILCCFSFQQLLRRLEM